MKNSILIFFLFFSAFGGYCQPINLDFENWYSDSSGKYKLYNWEHLSYANSPGLMLGTWVDSNAEHGLYALKISRWYGYVNDWVRQKAAISSIPGNLSGYYKYIDNDIQAPFIKGTALIEVILTKWNTNNAANDTIGYGNAKLLFNDSYTVFNCPITYSGTMVPDSITIHIKPSTLRSGSGMCQDVSARCSYLTVDNLSLSEATGVTLLQKPYFYVYPNPIKGKLVIHMSRDMPGPFQLCITDLAGKLLIRDTVLDKHAELDISKLAAGIYFLLLKDNINVLQVNKLLKQ